MGNKDEFSYITIIYISNFKQKNASPVIYFSVYVLHEIFCIYSLIFLNKAALSKKKITFVKKNLYEESLLKSKLKFVYFKIVFYL